MKAIELGKRLAENKAITVNLRYTGKGGNARKFAEEMTAGGTVAAIRAEAGNLRYEYYGNTAQSAFGIFRKIRALILSLFLAIHKVFLRKTTFIRTWIFSESALAGLCGVALII